MDRNEFFEFLERCRRSITKVLQFFKKPVKCESQYGSQQLLFAAEVMIEGGFSYANLFGNLNISGSLMPCSANRQLTVSIIFSFFLISVLKDTGWMKEDIIRINSFESNRLPNKN
jgi:hypothetical protein